MNFRKHHDRIDFDLTLCGFNAGTFEDQVSALVWLSNQLGIRETRLNRRGLEITVIIPAEDVSLADTELRVTRLVEEMQKRWGFEQSTRQKR